MSSINAVDTRKGRHRRPICCTRGISGRAEEGIGLRQRRLFVLLIGIVIPASLGIAPSFVSSASTSFDRGVGNVPQGTQSDRTYRASFGANGVTNVVVTSQQVSCYR